MSFVLVNDTNLSSKNSSSLNSTIMNKDVQDKNSNISEPNEIDAEVHNIMNGVVTIMMNYVREMLLKINLCHHRVK